MPLKLEVDTTTEGQFVRLAGAIDETADFGPLLQRLTGPRVVIDTYGITLINSAGVREWIEFMKSLEEVPEVELARCSPAMVNQLNCIYNFCGSARVTSVAVALQCEREDAEHLAVVELNDTDTLEQIAARFPPCPSCKGPLECDEELEHYFLFLDRS